MGNLQVQLQLALLEIERLKRENDDLRSKLKMANQDIAVGYRGGSITIYSV
ncbi:hypothetical protein [Paenibacillus puerhi]|uniref:hypothetical protein n=1 Tax=Paenibacillus puerhi TaxID=2692622 RepID=UPI001357638F|nr:hypothetical protein [Paenibacillus puerhi]